MRPSSGVVCSNMECPVTYQPICRPMSIAAYRFDAIGAFQHGASAYGRSISTLVCGPDFQEAGRPILDPSSGKVELVEAIAHYSRVR